MLPIKCTSCGKTFYRSRGRINEALKRNWRPFCSLKCQSKAKNKQKTLKCNNPSCNRIFKRQPKEIASSKNHFCSRSCSAIVNNSKSPKRRPKIRICPTCRREFTGQRKYCSSACWPKPNRLTKEQIIEMIKQFHKQNGRIPFKRESNNYRVVRRHFGTWNKAIKAAGFDPNPVMFAKKYIANDGHKCDSLAEKIIDDWLYRRKIKHKINVPYPENKPLTADFVVGDYWIEFFGLNGRHKTYDRLKRKKLRIANKLNLNLIAIYPQDLFPKGKLGKILNCLNQVK